MTYSQRPHLALISAIALLAVGCATLSHSSDQDVVALLLSAEGQKLVGLTCALQTPKLRTKFTSGSPVTVPRSSEIANITCDDPAGGTATGVLIPRANAGLSGNVIFGGLVGAAIDHGTGKGFDYPTHVALRIGQSREFDKRTSIPDSFSVGRLQSMGTRAPQTAIEASPLSPGFVIQVRDLDGISGRRTGDTHLQLTAIVSDRLELNGGSLVLSLDGSLQSGSPPMPHIAGLGGNKLTLGVTSRARFIPGGEVNPVGLNVRPVEKLIYTFAGKRIALFLCDVDGQGMVFGQAGPGMAASQRIQGHLLVEPTTGLVVAANVHSANTYYSFARDFAVDAVSSR